MNISKFVQNFLVTSKNDFFRIINRFPSSILGGHEPFEPAFDFALVSEKETFGEDDGLADEKYKGFLWAAPKKRKSLEKRWCVNIGAKNWLWKMFIPRYDLKTCETCGHHYQARHLCRNCYERIKKETEEIRAKIESDFGNLPEDKEVKILYQNEKFEDKNQNYRTVEIPKSRPAWFSTNLLQRTTAEPDHTTTTLAEAKPKIK